MTDRSEKLMAWGERAQDVSSVMVGVRKTLIENGFDAHVADHLSPSIAFSTYDNSCDHKQNTSAVYLPNGRMVIIPAGSILRIDTNLDLVLEMAGDDGED
jgi:hypothetical protein